jgi:hypothetical protein
MPLGFAKVSLIHGGGFSPIVATGGSTSTYTEGGVEYKAHTFTSSGTLSISDVGSEGLIEFLAIAGGASGGGGGVDDTGGGGGAGGALLETATLTATGSYSIVVGGGGAAQRWRSNPGANGGESTISNPSATVIARARRGGAGASYNANGSSGGSGGGSGGTSQNGGLWLFDTVNYPTTEQGNSGFRASGSQTGGGGGGYGGTNGSSQTTQSGTGQPGIDNTYRDGSIDKYAGGGGGGGNSPGSATAGYGGTNGTNTTQSANATANTGSGSGGSGGADNWSTGAGGSGIVIIRYLTGN